MSIQCIWPERKTPSVCIVIGDRTYYFSYGTLIAYSGPHSVTQEHVSLRVANTWGPTTGRHFNEWRVSNWPVVTTEELNLAAA